MKRTGRDPRGSAASRLDSGGLASYLIELRRVADARSKRASEPTRLISAGQVAFPPIGEVEEVLGVLWRRRGGGRGEKVFVK